MRGLAKKVVPVWEPVTVEKVRMLKNPTDKQIEEFNEILGQKVREIDINNMQPTEAYEAVNTAMKNFGF